MPGWFHRNKVSFGTFGTLTAGIAGLGYVVLIITVSLAGAPPMWGYVVQNCVTIPSGFFAHSLVTWRGNGHNWWTRGQWLTIQLAMFFGGILPYRQLVAIGVPYLLARVIIGAALVIPGYFLARVIFRRQSQKTKKA